MNAEQLAARTGTGIARIQELIAAGVLKAVADSSFPEADINRVRIAESLIAEGYALSDLARVIGEGHLSFRTVENLLASPMALDGRSLEERVVEADETLDQIDRLYEIWGLARPEPGQTAREDELRLLEVLAGFRAAGIDAERLVDATRYIGELTRRIAEGQIQFFRTSVIEPLIASGLPMGDVIERGIPVGGKLQPNARALVAWLHTRHFENAIVQNLVSLMEHAMEESGVQPAEPAAPPAIAFVDLTGYTSLTERTGDLDAARLATAFGDLVHHAAAAQRGRVVKLIGDGAMLHFAGPADAVRAGAQIVQRAETTGIPPARVGIHCGDVIPRDGDFFGRTVNVASRIQGHAHPREVLVSREVERACLGEGFDFEHLGLVDLKGLTTETELFRLAQDPEQRG